MTKDVPHYATLEEVLAANPIGAIFQKFSDAEAAYNQLHPEEAALRESMWNKIIKVSAKDPERKKIIEDADENTPEGIRAIAQAIRMSQAMVKRVIAFENKRYEARRSVQVDHDALILEWCELKKRAGIQEITETELDSITKPTLALYSGDWCPPCRLMRPTFGHLAPFFTHAEIRYRHVARGCGGASLVQGVPQLVAAFPDGRRILSYVGGSAQQIWDIMNNLFTLGASWEGNGRLQCTEESCGIVELTD